MNNSLKIFLGIVLLLTSGCATVAHLDELLALKQIDNDQKQMDRCIKRQDAAFARLSADVHSGKIKKGILKQRIIAEYGEPIVTTSVNDGSSVVEVILYRHPTRYFDSDKIYLYFDASQKLVRIEYKPFKKG
jgi:hypothetical protein